MELSRLALRKSLLSKRPACLAAALAISSLLAVSSAQSAPLSLKEGQLNVNQAADKLGRLQLPQGQVKIAGSDLSIKAVPDWLFDRHTVLSGQVVSANYDASSQSVSALTYFTGGDWLSELTSGRKRAKETITLKSGSSLTGNVRSVSGGKLNFEVLPGQVQALALSDIQSISSPFAFRLDFKVGDVKLNPDTQELTAEAASVALRSPQAGPAPGSNKAILTASSGLSLGNRGETYLPASRLPGTEGGITKNKIAGMIAMDTINTLAPIVAIPLVVPLGERGAINKLNSFQQADIANYVFNFPTVPSSVSRF